jgi:hypothetical protein
MTGWGRVRVQNRLWRDAVLQIETNKMLLSFSYWRFLTDTERRLLGSSCMAVCLSFRMSRLPLDGFSLNLNIGNFYRNLSRDSKFR